jgi:hypothetical protein
MILHGRAGLCVPAVAGCAVALLPHETHLRLLTCACSPACSPALLPCSANELPSPVVSLELKNYPPYSTPLVEHTLQPRCARGFLFTAQL